jgi:hypothetical protein
MVLQKEEARTGIVWENPLEGTARGLLAKAATLTRRRELIGLRRPRAWVLRGHIEPRLGAINGRPLSTDGRWQETAFWRIRCLTCQQSKN